MSDPDRNSMLPDLIHHSFNGFRLPCGGKLSLEDCKPSSEDVVRCIGVTVVANAAHSACPLPNRQAGKPLRPAHGSTAAAHPRGAVLGHLHKPRACVIAFVLQHGSHRAPARIHHALGVRTLGKRLRIHITHTDHGVPGGQLRCELVQEVLSSVGDLGVDGFDPMLLPRTLRCGQRRLQVAVEALGLYLVAIAQHSQVFQPQVDADRGALRCDPRRALHVDRDIEVPTPARVFAEAARTQFVLTQAPAVPHREPLAGVIDLAVCVLDGADLEGQPSQRAAHALALAPRQAHPLVLAPAPGVLFGRFLHSLYRQIERVIAARAALQVRPEIESGEELALALEDADLQVVAVVPDRVDLARELRKPRRMSVLHAHAQNAGGVGGVGAVHSYSVNKIANNAKEMREQRAALPRGALSLPALNDRVSRAK